MTQPYSSRREPAFLEIEGAIATIVLNKPGSYNAIDVDLAIRLRDLALQLTNQSQVKVVIIRGEGRAFCSGGDIHRFVQNSDNIDSYIRQLLAVYHEFLMLLRKMPKLVLASVHGSAAGAGLSLVSMCDLCIATDDCVFVPSYANIGVSPDGGGTYGLVRAVGLRRALQIFLAEESFSAHQAADWGLVTRVVPAISIADETATFAARLSSKSVQAQASTKRLLDVGVNTPLQNQLIDEMESLISCMAGDEFLDATKRFVRKGVGLHDLTIK